MSYFAVLGAGSWGATIAQHLVTLDHQVNLWSKFDHEVELLRTAKAHPFIEDLSLDKKIQLTSNLEEAIDRAEYIVIAIPSHFVRDLFIELKNVIKNDQKYIILSKGIENDTLLTMSQVVHEAGDISKDKIIALYGPSHAEEVAKDMPTTLVSACVDEGTAKEIQHLFSSPTLRIYSNTDILGVELGGSLKNVFAIAAGICDGIGYGDNTKAALMTRGMYEMIRLGTAMGAQKETFQGLSGIGDVIVTCLSQHSRNRSVGEKIGQGKKLDEVLNEMQMIAEGVKMAKSVHQLKKKYDIEMPISEAVYRILFENDNAKEAITALMIRGLKPEN